MYHKLQLLRCYNVPTYTTTASVDWTSIHAELEFLRERTARDRSHASPTDQSTLLSFSRSARFSYHDPHSMHLTARIFLKKSDTRILQNMKVTLCPSSVTETENTTSTATVDSLFCAIEMDALLLLLLQKHYLKNLHLVLAAHEMSVWGTCEANDKHGIVLTA